MVKDRQNRPPQLHSTSLLSTEDAKDPSPSKARKTPTFYPSAWQCCVSVRGPPLHIKHGHKKDKQYHDGNNNMTTAKTRWLQDIITHWESQTSHCGMGAMYPTVSSCHQTWGALARSPAAAIDQSTQQPAPSMGRKKKAVPDWPHIGTAWNRYHWYHLHSPRT